MTRDELLAALLEAGGIWHGEFSDTSIGRAGRGAYRAAKDAGLGSADGYRLAHKAVLNEIERIATPPHGRLR
jgi:hypothetical protein